MAESLPTSLSAFSHRRQRADSTASFAYYTEEENDLERRIIYDEDGSMSFEIDETPFDHEEEDEEGSSELELENGNSYDDYAMRRRSSIQSRTSVHARLLRTDSGVTDASGRGHSRVSQKLHMVNEDLTIVIAGFRTSRLGYAAYIFICVATLGLAYLLLRWLPRWQVKLIGEPCPLHDCQWAVLEVSCFAWTLVYYVVRCIDHTIESMGRNGYSQRACPTV